MYWLFFLISEVPRLYLNTSLVSTFGSDLGKDDIAWTKAKSEINKRSTACFKRADSVVQKFTSKWNLSIAENLSQFKNSSCGGKPLDRVDISSVSDLVDDVVIFIYEDYGNALKERTNPIYGAFIETLFEKLSVFVKSNYERVLTKISLILDCSVETVRTEYIMVAYALEHSYCYENVINAISEIMPYLILGSSPYAEPMNYIMNVVLGYVDINLEDLKTFMEVMKISTVLACASNFIIYIVMSEKLRTAFSRRLSISTALE